MPFLDTVGGGIKTRKLEGCLAYIARKRHTDLLVIVPNVSSLRADLELFATEHNLRLHFIVADDPPISIETRLASAVGKHVEYTIVGRSKLVAVWFSGWQNSSTFV